MSGKGAVAPSSGTRTAWIMLTIAIILLNGGNLILESVYSGSSLSLEMFLQPGFFAPSRFSACPLLSTPGRLPCCR
ncbi:hypothetical protein [Defluviicoccus vanus]|uniref:Uncharacterized protein n=1 Tax=Defluviicoccus vanus TaxID=111831 RepID=A0A7H1N3Y9_9PROT|nr:hypothetical protein [Defluviicoccus vanus]QNT70425.1 hypothetical protein HQ394_15185 [Defluviicoccus vanus]